MSFVSMVVRNNFLSVVSDGRVILLDTREVLTEECTKISIATDKFFFATCGHKKVGEAVTDTLTRFNLFEGNIEKIIEVVTAATVQVGGYNRDDVNLVAFFGGIINNQIIGYHINSWNNKLNILQSEVDEISLIFNGNPTKDGDLDKVFLSKLKSAITVDQTLEVQREMNDIVAAYDDSVNNVHFHHIIKL